MYNDTGIPDILYAYMVCNIYIYIYIYIYIPFTKYVNKLDEIVYKKLFNIAKYSYFNKKCF